LHAFFGELLAKFSNTFIIPKFACHVKQFLQKATNFQNAFMKQNHLFSTRGQNMAGQYRTKIVRQMRRQIFRQMKQKAE